MAVGGSASPVVPSYVALGKESSFGTYASATTAVEALSCSFRTDVRSMKINAIGSNRGYNRRVTLEKTAGGTLETYLHPQESVLLVAAAMGGGVASSVTSVGGTYTHSVTAGNFNTAPASLSFNVRKGDTLTWRYSGGRVNSLRIAAAVNEPVRLTAEMVFKDSTLQSDDISGNLSISTVLPFTFVQGKYRYAANETNAGTSTAEEPILGFELTVNNNFATGPESRELGSAVYSVIPATKRDISFSVRQRFDTSTTYNRFIQATQGAVELFFQGAQITSSSSVAKNYEMTVRLPKVFYVGSDPIMNSPNEILVSEIPFDVVVDDPDTTTGKDIGITFQNEIASY